MIFFPEAMESNFKAHTNDNLVYDVFRAVKLLSVLFFSCKIVLVYILKVIKMTGFFRKEK